MYLTSKPYDDFMIGSWPLEESGKETKQTEEAAVRFKALLNSYFVNIKPNGASFRLRDNPYDLGSYKTVNVIYPVYNPNYFYPEAPHYENYQSSKEFLDEEEFGNQPELFMGYWFSLFVEREAPQKWKYTSQNQYEMELRWWEDVLWKEGSFPQKYEENKLKTVNQNGIVFETSA